MKKLTTAQKIALNTFLTEYAYDLDFETTLQKISNNEEADTDIIVGDFFDDINRSTLSQLIEILAEDIQRAIDSGEK